MRERRFFGQRIEVTCEKDDTGFQLPCRFTLGDNEIRVADVLRRWHDYAHPSTSRRRTWLERKHRTYYRVRATDGSIYELYVDRTGGRRDWFLTRRAARTDSHQAAEDDARRECSQE